MTREYAEFLFVLAFIAAATGVGWVFYHKGFRDGGFDQRCTDRGGEVLASDGHCAHVTVVQIDAGTAQ
jgi:hypothetical protein